MKNRLTLLIFLISAQSGIAFGQETTPQPPKPTAEIQKLLDEAAKTPMNERERAYRRVLERAKELKDLAGQAMTLDPLGRTCSALGEQRKALECFQLVLPIVRELHFVRGEAVTLYGIGWLYNALGEGHKALEYYEKALPLQHDLGPKGEADTLNNMGLVYRNLGQLQESLLYFEKALPVRRRALDRAGESLTLSGTGSVYVLMGQKQKALDCYGQALQVAREIKDRRGEALALGDMAVVYHDLGQEQMALSTNEQALAIRKEIGDRLGQARTLGNIGNVYFALNNVQGATDSFTQALAMEREVGDRLGESHTLNDLGTLAGFAGRREDALKYLEQALQIEREIGDRVGEASTLGNIGMAHEKGGDRRKALEYYERALPITRETGDRFEEANRLHKVSRAENLLGLRKLAIASAKKGVIVWQSLRKDNRGLSRALQSSFKGIYEDQYRSLADLLISEGRLAEAKQVLDLLKDDEYFRLLRRGAGETVAVDLTPREREWSAKYEAVASDVTSIATDYEEEKKKDQPDATKLASMRAELAKAETAVQAFLDSAKAEFDKAGAKSNRLDDLASSQALGRVLGKLPNRPAAIYTLMTQDGVRMILKLPSVSVLRSSSSKVSATELNKKIFAFRTALTNPSLDPRPLGGELYDILIRPIEKDLAASKTQTLLWSLDGPLRYIPIWALYDAKEKRYLIEKYPSSIFTPRTIDRLAEAGDPKWSGVGFASSQAHKIGEDSFSGLPNAAQELATVSKLLGKGYADAKFTQTALVSEMEKGPEVLHIVSHFRFKPEDENGSYLVLGDGKSLSLATFKDLPEDVLGHVNLLVLSACETAMSGDADGSEFEGFALLAQLKGAGSVLATLWPVADESTALLMGEFYRIHSKNPRMAKLEALRQAQLEMLNGVTKGTAGKPRNLGIEPSKNPGFKQFVTDPKRPFAHPYYWAPFVIFGNWR